MGRVIVLTPKWLLLLALWPTWVAGSELEVQVVTRSGEPLPGHLVQIGPPERSERAGNQHAFVFSPATRARQQTNELGRARFLDLVPETYQVDLYHLERYGLVSPRNNPQAPPPVIRLEPGEARTVVVEVWGGTWVTARMLVRGDEVNARAVFVHRDSGLTRTAGLRETSNQSELLLPAGIWQVRLEPPSGYLLESIDRDGYPLTGSTVTLDLNDDPRSTDVTFSYRVDAHVEGEVTVTSPGPNVAVEATLLVPGPWFAEASQRGGSEFRRVVRSVGGRGGDYRLPLPSGRWRVRPISVVPLESDPPEVELSLTEGAVERVDFEVDLSTGPDKLTVSVGSRKRGRIAGAVVEIRGEGAPAGPSRTGAHGSARIFGLEPGREYSVLAGHPDFFQAETTIRYEPKRRYNRETRSGSSVFLHLEEGAGFELEAADTAGAPLPKVELSIERLAVMEDDGSSSVEELYDLPPISLQDEAYRASKLRRTVVSDRRGRAKATGLYPGNYELSAELQGSEAVLGHVLVAVRRSEYHSELEAELEEAEILRVNARQVPAARFAATLLCDDGGVLPPAADVNVFRALESRDGVTLSVWDDEPAVALERRPLEGELSDRLVAGPLDTGVFEVAIKPQGFDRWTWAFETTDRYRAMPLAVEDSDVQSGRELDLGTFVVECEPTVNLVISTAEGVEIDPSRLEASVRLFDLEIDDGLGPGVPADPGEAQRRQAVREIPPPPHALTGNQLTVRRIPAGRTRLQIEILHPQLLPEGNQVFEIDLDLERGGHLERELQLRDIGGTIVVATEAVVIESGATLRISQADSIGASTDGRRVPPAMLDVTAGETWVEPLAPGVYSIQLCVDPACTQPVASWSDVELVAGQVRRLHAR